jgi:hypothetical protein
VLAQAGIAEAEALVPEPGERGAAGFCPLCGGQYRAAVERCGDCGVAVLPLAAPAPAREA